MKKYKKIIILALILVILLLILMTFNKHKEEKQYLHISDFANSKEVIEYFKDIYIKERQLTHEEYDIEIYVIFNTKLDLENRSHFENLVSIIAEVNQYKNIKIIDEKNNIEIKITCNKEEKIVIQTLINGKDDYFSRIESELTLDTPLKIENIQIDLSNTQLDDIIKNDWKINKINLGTKESEFDKYDIYFDEGIKVKLVNDRIFNIVFTRKYTKDVLPNIKTSMEYEEIVSALGKPTIYNNETNIYGYKSDDIYVFFSDNEISVYPNIDYDNKNILLEIISDYSQNYNQNEIIYKITETLTDYNNYNYSYDAYLQYTLRGLEININRQGKLKILVYGNYKGNVSEDLNIEQINDLNKNEISELILLQLDKDLVFETERKRVIYKKGVYKEAYDIDNISPDDKIGLSYLIDKAENKIGLKIISLDDEYFNYKMVIENLESVIWLDSQNIIFSQKGYGIYKYNVYTKEIKTLIEANEQFSNLKIEDKKIIYDGNKEIYI